MIGLYSAIRPVSDGDDARLLRMFGRLSRQTVHRRFFTLVAARPDSPVLKALTAVDHDVHEALVMPVGDEIVALASYHRRADDPTVADIAVLVEDGWQHHGLGARLTRQVARTARARGVRAFHADVLADNDQGIGLVHRMNPRSRANLASGELSFDLPISA